MKKYKTSLLFSLFLFIHTNHVYAEILERVDGQAYYDTVLDITWLADAHLSTKETFGVSDIRYVKYGGMSWYTAKAWIAGMNASNYLGVNQWRLPKSRPINGVSFSTISTRNGTTDNSSNIGAQGTMYEGSTASELAHLYYNTLGHIRGNYDIDGTKLACGQYGLIVSANSCLINNGPFSTYELMSVSQFWTETKLNSSNAFSFSFYMGYQTYSWVGYYGSFLAWPVVDGDPLGISDVDGDGFADADDMCKQSDTSNEVSISGCDTSVVNALDNVGCTISDKINLCKENSKNHGHYLKCTTNLMNELTEDGILRPWEKGSVISCAAKTPF